MDDKKSRKIEQRLNGQLNYNKYIYGVTMKNIKVILFLFVFIISVANATEIVSPNKKVKVVLELQNESQPKFMISYSENQKTTEVLASSLLGLKTKSQDFSELTLISQSKITLVHDDYEMLHGKKKHCENFGSEKTFRFKNASDKCIDIIFRIYNDGVAFRYILCDYDETLNSVTEELTTYTIPDGIERWIQPYNEVYETFYPFSTNARANRQW